MVAHYGAIIGFVIACQILFFAYGIKHEAKSDRYFYSLSINSIAIIVSLALNMFCIHAGNTGIFISKIALSTYFSLFTILAGTLTSINIEYFNDKAKNSYIVKFILSIIVFTICSMTYMNLLNNSFFNYNIKTFSPFEFIFDSYSNIMVPEFVSLWSLFEFFWVCIILMYFVLSVIRIIMRGPENSVKEFFILSVFLVELFLFVFFSDRPENFMIQTAFFAILVPGIYYIINYHSKPVFVKKTLRSRLFDHANDSIVIFNADGFLTDYNIQAKKMLGFNQKDIYKLTVNNFVKDYVPLGAVPSDSFSIDQIYIKTKNDNRLICQLDYHKIVNFANTTVCSYFILHNISTLFENFAEIQHASMTDHITGLFAQHVLMKKIREINIFRKFPYSAASCSIQIKSNQNDVNENFALVKVSEYIKSKIRGSDFAAYENGNIILLFNAEQKIAQNVMERIISAIEEDDYLKDDVTVKYGLTEKENPDEDIQQTINRAHAIMFKNKIESSIHGLNPLQ